MTTPENQTIATQRRQTLRDLLERARPSLAQVLPRHLTPDRLVKVALAACSRQPVLLQATPQSILQALMQAAQLGLEAGGPLGHAYLVPYRSGRSGQYEVQLIPGYRGLIDLARRSGTIESIEARVVHERDRFELAFGLAPELVHTPSVREEPGAPVAVYAIARIKGGGIQIEVLRWAEVESIRARSRAASDGPWVTDTEEMARKTAVRRLCKYLPLSADLATALDLEQRAEAGESPSVEIEIPGDVEAAEPSTQAESIKRKLRPAPPAATPEDPVIPVIDRTRTQPSEPGATG